ncbi:MAG: hypothetical protein VX734_01660, partial [Actinomycetota bacterium]|nr:hypothetical protein [Actinomycetota bacterium]
KKTENRFYVQSTANAKAPQREPPSQSEFVIVLHDISEPLESIHNNMTALNQREQSHQKTHDD